jgi:ATP-dependent RNA helicase RhlE
MTPDNLQDDDMSFNELGLGTELLKAIEANGYTIPTPIQSRVIPAILDGGDILARAQTGTGKTDAFALPVVEILSRQTGRGRHPRALVLTPTRELALQVGECIKAYARRVAIRCTVVYGGVRTSPQIDRLRRGIDILVATPGRLLDLAAQWALNLSRIEFLVFDEADRMLDMGFSDEISEILDIVPSERRTMLFSATYTQQIRDLAAIMLKDPAHIEVTPRQTAAESVDQKLHLVDRANKRALLIHLITRGGWTQVLVFTRTKHGANKLTEKLAAKKISAAALHSNKSQSFRTRTLKEFKSGEIRVLVATDVAARGLDISNLPYVVNYDVPSVPEDYVHRIGRTGRAGVRGIAVSLVSDDEKPYLQAIEKLINRKIPVEKVDGYTEDSAVPDFVLFRPDSPSSEQKADPAIKEWVSRRKAVKERSKIRRAKTIGSDKSAGSASKSRSGGKAAPAGKKTSRSLTRSHQTPKQGTPRGRR